MAVLRERVLRLRVKNLLVLAWLILASSAAVYADEHSHDWIPDVLEFPEDAEVVSERAIGSTIRMFTIATSADVDTLLANWEEGLNSDGYPVAQGTEDLLNRSIEFSGPGITNAKIVVAPMTEGGRSIIEFDATLD